jgi:Zn finger protein HypA/HybF involved in hydrogenase expression
MSDVLDPQKAPEKIKIKSLQKEFEPVDFQHGKIIKRLIAVSNQNPLAKWFHSGNQNVACESCHHHTPQQAQNSVPKCASCHGRPFDPSALNRPGIQAAYHRQCMECHQHMQQKPLPMECVKCHAEQKGVRTDQLIPPLEGNGSHIGIPVKKGE